MKLNLGSGPKVADGWVNVDYALGARLARVPGFKAVNRRVNVFQWDWPDEVFLHNLKKPFPWATGSVDHVYTSHTLVHFTRTEGRRVVEECHRVLKPGGILRVVVPDFSFKVNQYVSGELRADEFLDGFAEREDWDAGLKRYVTALTRYPIVCYYDAPSLERLMTSCGLECEQREPFESAIPDISAVETLRKNIGRSAIVEGTKPG